MKEMKKVDIYSDGACLKNPGPGGWCAVLTYNGTEKILSGGEAYTTNNKMELTAVISGLEALKEPCEVSVYTDSRYVTDGISLGWAVKWQKNNWIKSDKKPALNIDLWERLLNVLDKHEVNFIWIKGHSGHEYNELCDLTAKKEAQTFLSH